jgi:hypothetical protein
MKGWLVMDRRAALKALIAIPSVKEIAIADVKPNDVIVIETDGPISVEAAANIREAAERIWPDRKIAVLGDGMRLRIARGVV